MECKNTLRNFGLGVIVGALICLIIFAAIHRGNKVEINELRELNRELTSEITNALGIIAEHEGTISSQRATIDRAQQRVGEIESRQFEITGGIDGAIRIVESLITDITDLANILGYDAVK